MVSNLMLPMESKESAPDWAFAQLVRRIVTGELPAGSRITEEQLAADLGVSRTPLRAALVRLENARLIIKQRNRALYVSPLRAEEIEELSNLRERIEGLVASRAAIRVSRGEVSTDRARLICQQIDTKGFGNPFDLFTLGESFHAEIIRLSGMSRASDMLAELYLGLERYRYILAEDPARAPKRTKEHQDILEAIEAGEPDNAENLMRLHIRNALDIYLDRLAPMFSPPT
ncbi:GntR family transcriptional regulator [Microvirga sp. P5_D2]